MTIYQWLTILGIPSLVAGLFGFIRVQMSQNRAINLAVRAMLRDRLLQGYKHYISQGYADLDDRSNMENVYTQYKALKGNGDMRDLRRTFRHLPMIPGGLPTEVSDDDGERRKTEMTDWKKWAVAALIRAVRTFAEAMIAYIGTGAVVLGDVNWLAALSAGGMGFVIAILLALTGLPEVGKTEADN